MPQIKYEDRDEFFEFVRSKGVSIEKKTLVDPKKLKATQKNFNREKIAGMMNNKEMIAANRPIIISLDDYVLDGHHTWLAFYNIGKEINTIRIKISIDELLVLSKNFSKTFTKTINEEVNDDRQITVKENAS